MSKDIYTHFVYKTTNQITGQYYIGKHSTTNPNDGYLGSGTRLNRAIKKYGRKNFKVEVLREFDSSELAYEYEALIVTNEMIKSDECYNMCLGGEGGNLLIKTKEHRRNISKSKTGKCLSKEHIEAIRLGNLGNTPVNKGVPHTKEARIKMSKKKLGIPRKKVECPHCSKIGADNVMKRWHFDNCKLKPE